MKSDIKLIIESLYDLGVIQRKKRRKKKVKKLLNTVRSSGAPMSQNSSISSSATPFINTSNLQNEYLREQLLTLENSNAQKPQFRELENQIENNRIFQNQTQRALLYLHNQSNPIIEEIGYDDDDNIDVTSTGGSDGFGSEEASEPVKQSLWGSLFGSANPTPTPLKSFANNLREEMDEFEASPYNSDIEETPFKRVEKILGFDDEEDGGGGARVKKSYKDNREELKNIYKEKGGIDPKILLTGTKKTIEGAIKDLDDLEKYQSLYENVLGGNDDILINGDIRVLGRLKKEVKERIRELNKGKKDKTSVKELLSRR